MRKHVLTGLTVASTLGLLVSPLAGYAFGLGKLELMSALNQPLRAEIDVTALQADEKTNLTVSLASSDEFQKAGLERSLLLTQLQFDIVEKSGQTKVLITSEQAVKEPFLNFLLTATAGSGRLMREYTVLLDPPEFVSTPRTTTSTTSTPATQAATQAQSTRTSNQVTRYGPVKRTDTLWNIAQSTLPNNSISVHQMMMALLKANPDAFTNNNVNGLKAGYTLQIPNEAAIRAMSQQQASAAFAEQTTAWSNRNSANSAGIAEATEAQAEVSDDTEAEQPSNVVTAQPAGEQSENAQSTVTTQNDGRLKLVAPEEDVNSEDDVDPNVSGNEQLEQLTEQLTLAQETIEAQTQENIDFKARMDAMEDQLETMRRLISLKDADLARLQDLLEEDPALVEDVVAELSADSNTSDNADAMTSDSEVTASDAENAQSATSDDATSIQNNADASVDAETTERPLTAQDQVLSLIDRVKQFVFDNKLSVAAAALLILLLLLLLLRRRDKDDADSDEQVLDVAPVAVEPTRSQQQSSLTDAPLSEPEEQLSVDELLEQADMFVGYADYIQAKQALVLAHEIEPANMLVAYKLLFVLFKQKQADQFLAVVEENAFDQQYESWDEVRSWGHELMPANPLFFAEVPLDEQPIATEADADPIVVAAEQENEQEVVTTDTLEYESTSVTELETTQQQTDETLTDNHDDDRLEFDLDAYQSQPETAADDEAEEIHDISSELTESDDELLAFDADEYQSETVENDIDTLDLTDTLSDDELSDDLMAFDVDNADETTEDEPFEIDDLSTPNLEFDIGELDDMDEAETKLELAEAYVEMGDADGARSMLNEVLANGSDDQQARAKTLLDKL